MPSRIFLFFMCFSLAACGSAPRPFKSKAGDWTNPLAEPVGGYDIRVEPVDGPAKPMALLLSRSVAAALAAKDVPATVEGTAKSRFVLRGKAEPNWDGPRASYIIVIRWVLSDAKGNTVGDYTQGVRGEWFEWENGDPKIIRAVGQEAAQPFAEMIRKKEEVLPPAELRGSGLLVKDVTGAPGDGGRALTAAIKESLTLTDVSVTEDPRQVDYVLQGVVDVSAPVKGKQWVKVTWTVSTLAGAKVGAATQENRVAAGSLNGAWGKIASQVASAAIGGIGDILARANKPRVKEAPKERDETRKKSTRPPRLKQIPGKAPPPPI
ncbi:MAG TPA: hypothetical protein ENI79_02595 [Rhodospirillales bacterium]|nr:hypothetical protein [Rhodospirillales bacterium]